MYELDFTELLVKALKYLFQGLAIAIVAHLLDMIGPHKLTGWEVAILGATAACVFAIFDVVSPSLSESTQQGIGLATGFKLMRFPY